MEVSLEANSLAPVDANCYGLDLRHGGVVRKMLIAASAVAQAASVILLQLLAIVSLDPRAFGEFSALYLFFAMSSSALLSIVCEAWQRHQPHAQWKEYSAALTWISAAGGIVTILVFLWIPGFGELAWLGGIAVAFATYRTGARYHSLQQRQLRWVFPGDILSGAVLAAGWVVFIVVGVGSFDPAILVALWAGSAVVSSLGSRPPTSIRFTAVRWWLVQHKRQIRVLLADSIVLDASGIGVPYVLIPVVGTSGFGIYRAISNISSPVKLLLFPLRPLFASFSVAQFARFKTIVSLLSLGLAIGGACYFALIFITTIDVDLGTLSALRDYALAAAVFVGATFLNGVYYLVGRTHFRTRTLLMGRFVTSALGIVLPILGAVTGGLQWAIILTAASTVTCALMWIVLTIADGRKTSRGEHSELMPVNE